MKNYENPVVEVLAFDLEPVRMVGWFSDDDDNDNDGDDVETTG